MQLTTESSPVSMLRESADALCALCQHYLIIVVLLEIVITTQSVVEDDCGQGECLYAGISLIPASLICFLGRLIRP